MFRGLYVQRLRTTPLEKYTVRGKEKQPLLVSDQSGGLCAKLAGLICKRERIWTDAGSANIMRERKHVIPSHLCI